MKEEAECSHLTNNTDGLVASLQPWIPAKTLIENFKGFQISSSSTSEEPDNSVQFGVVHPTIHGDILRVDNYPEGYFAATWLSTVKLPEFLDGAERYFQEFEHEFTGEIHGKMGVFIARRLPELYDFVRPITMDDLERDRIFVDDDEHPLALLRIDTSPGDIIYEPKSELAVGIIAYLDQGREQPTIDAVARLVTRTQAQLPEDVVVRVIGLLPYRRVRKESD